MFKAPVFTAEGERSSERTLPSSFFDGVVHETAMWQAVKAYRANQRLGTAATKNRSQVRGGNRKPWRQKGTGRARHGSIRSPIWRGGGVAFGPRGDQNFRERIPRKVKGLARRSAFNARAEDGRVILLDGLSLDTPKTRRIIALLESLEAEGNVLLLTDGPKSTVHLSARNIPQVLIRPFGQESTYDVLWSDTVIIEVSALDSLPGGGEEAGAENEAPAAPRKRTRKPKADAVAEVAAEAAREPTAGTEPETQPSDTLAGEPEPEAAEESAPRKRRTRKKAAEPEEGEE